MKKDELVSAVANSAGCDKKTANAVIDALGDAVSAALKAGDDVALPGIGKFSTGARPARKGRNPKTGAEITIAAKTAVKYKVAKALNDTVNS